MEYGKPGRDGRVFFLSGSLEPSRRRRWRRLGSIETERAFSFFASAFLH
jgi:hypothetical protein